MPRSRLALCSIAAAAGVLYAWRLGANGLHPYYAPAVKSMSVSWKAFLYGGYDPAASITLDKLPGAFMVQALSVRLFGFHAWALLLPQVLASVLTVLVLYRVVRRWQGPIAGVISAILYALTPIVAATARAQISDTILVLLLVLAADAWQRAVTTARTGSLVWCGVWVGLAFQAKMVQAWGVLPAFGLVYLFAAPASWRRRLGQLGLAGLAAGAVSLWWMVLVTLVPATSRPYIDGSSDNSVWSMVFGYNLFDRYGTNEPSWWYLLGDATAPQVGWLYPMALAGLVFGVWWRGRAARTDPVRAGFLMWGLWLAVHAVALSTGRVAHVFYVIAIAPAVIALSAGGLVTLWEAHRSRMTWVLPTATAVTAAWAVYLSFRFPAFLPWMAPTVAVVGSAATLGLLLSHGSKAVAAVGLMAILLAPAAWAVSTVDPQHAGTAIGPAAGVGGDSSVAPQRLGGLPSPGTVPRARLALNGPGGPPGLGGPPGATGIADRVSPRGQRLLDFLASQHHGQKYLAAVQAPESTGDLLLSGRSILPMGGFSGRTPFPTTDQLTAMVADGRLRFVLLGPLRPGTLDWSAWAATHCRTIEPGRYGAPPQRAERLYDCAPAIASPPS